MRDTILRMNRKLSITCENHELFTEYRQAGADEVILALKDSCFSPLKAFDKQEMVKLIEEAHQYGLEVSVLMNRLFHENDAVNACETMKRLVEAGADGIIFADTALAYTAKREGFMNRMIFQPETMMTSSFDAKVWHDLGTQAVMISSLLTKEEVIHIASCIDNGGVNVHGYQMMSVSGRPLLSAYAQNRGLYPLKNKGNLFLVEEKRDGKMPVYENDYCTMVFSDYIQESFDEMKAFMNAGVKRFVIDSWMLKETCVKDTLRIYRAYLDGKETEEMVRTYRKTYGELPLSSGYYEQKTVR